MSRAPGNAVPVPSDSSCTDLGRPLPEPFRWREGQIEIDLPGGRVLFTTRSGGDLASTRSGSEHLQRAVGLPPGSWVQDRQVHERRVRVVGAGEPVGSMMSDSDGIATARRDIACVVRTADCVPIALVSAQAVAMLHGGWRGLAAGVVEEGVRALRELGATDIQAAIGPHARVCCYETGDEVQAAFEHLGPAVRQGRHVDLEAVSRALLEQQEVREVHAVGACTICSPAGAFWSYRRDSASAGRQGGIAWRS